MPENQTSEQSTASQTLALLRRLDGRFDQVAELLVQRQEALLQLKRHMHEGFSRLQRDMKCDMALDENRIASSVAADPIVVARLNDHEKRLEVLEGRRLSL